MSQHGCPERLSNRSKGFQEDGPSQPTMEVLVETLTGTAFEMTVSPSDTIFAIKSKIFRVEGIPVSQQHLLYNLKELDNASSLREHSISDGARLRLVLGMCGGPITTRRLPPPPNAEPWRDIERLLDSNREESEWGGNGCKVTVLVFREGERVNMLRVRENRDGTYSPLDHNKYSSSLTHLLEQEPDDGLSGSLHENAVTMGKMLELRRRMESLSVQRRRADARTDKPEIQKTRSEETLSVPSLLDEAGGCSSAAGSSAFSYSDASPFAPLYDGNYTRYEYDCAFADRYSLLPGIGPRSDSSHSVHEAVHDTDSERLNALDSGLVVGGRASESGRDECLLPHDADLAANLAAIPAIPTIPAAEYGPLVGGEAGGWRAAGFGSVGSVGGVGGLGVGGMGGLPGVGGLGAPRGTPPLAHSASSLHVRAPRHHAPLSSSTSDLEQLKRNRILPTLSRHRNREHLHLSDEGLDMAARPRNLEVGSERRQRRIERIAEMEGRHASDHAREPPVEADRPVSPAAATPAAVVATPAPAEPEAVKGKVRIRCGLCNKRLSIATVHRCRCGAQFCAPHRYAEVHGCAYDYKAHAHHYLQRANPLVSAPKLPKI